MGSSLKRFSFQALGTNCVVQIFDESRINAKKLSQRLAGEATRIDKKYSRFERFSATNEINRSHGNSMGVKIDSETKSLLNHALSCYEKSEGLFDITAGILHHIWDFQRGIAPVQTQIDKLLPHIGFHRIGIKGSRLYLPENMQVDFSSFIREYAADAIAKLGRNLGISEGLLNIGGTFASIGPQPGDQPWTIGVANPKEDAALMAKLDISRGGLTSSGDYQRTFDIKGKKYSYILNPKTGWPNDGLRSVSVATHLCTAAGIFAVIAMQKEEEDAKQYLLDSGLPHIYLESS